MAPRISVLVPAYNDGRYLGENLRSLELQTLRDFEAIIADDASSDDTPEIARAWARRDPRFRLSRVESNLGMNPNWNRALAEASGDYVIKLDADDVMQPDCLLSLRQEFDLRAGLRFAACRTLDCDEALNVVEPFLGDQGLRNHGLEPEIGHVMSGFEWLRLAFDDIQLWTSDALMFRTDDLRALGGWDARWVAADADLILRALATDRPVSHVPLPGILYRRRPGSSSARQRASTGPGFEVSMICLRTLAKHGGQLRPWNRALRQNWWRQWHRFRVLSRDSRAWEGLAVGRREAISTLARETARLAPPLWIRVEGELRRLLWRLKWVLRRDE